MVGVLRSQRSSCDATKLKIIANCKEERITDPGENIGSGFHRNGSVGVNSKILAGMLSALAGL